ncbi:MAG: GNAT family N-acetyltransferase [Dehalococcoidia bacterium]|nr:GNAT family N-acetyltransferase [Dehalococcoidia bacterium]
MPPEALDASLHIEGPSLGRPAECMPVLRALPQWFGIESANEAYAADIEELPTFVARLGEDVVGFVSVKQHFPVAAELHVLGVRPEHHRHGIGRHMLERVEAWLREQRVEYVQVKTRGPSQPDEGTNARAPST